MEISAIYGGKRLKESAIEEGVIHGNDYDSKLQKKSSINC